MRQELDGDACICNGSQIPITNPHTAPAALSVCGVTGVLSVCYQCVTSVLPVCYQCVTSALPVRYHVCKQCAPAVLSVCKTGRDHTVCNTGRADGRQHAPQMQSSIRVSRRSYRRFGSFVGLCFRSKGVPIFQEIIDLTSVNRHKRRTTNAAFGLSVLNRVRICTSVTTHMCAA